MFSFNTSVLATDDVEDPATTDPNDAPEETEPMDDPATTDPNEVPEEEPEPAAVVNPTCAELFYAEYQTIQSNGSFNAGIQEIFPPSHVIHYRAFNNDPVKWYWTKEEYIGPAPGVDSATVHYSYTLNEAGNVWMVERITKEEHENGESVTRITYGFITQFGTNPSDPETRTDPIMQECE